MLSTLAVAVLFQWDHNLGHAMEPTLEDRERFMASKLAYRIGDVQQGDITSLPLADATMDAVADFGIIHHVPDWRAAIAEVARVLAPGGQFLFEEVTSHALARAS